MPIPQRNGYASRANILKYIKVSDKWRFAPAQTSNNKLKMDWVLIDGKPERHPEGTYYIEWYENKKRCRQSVKDSAGVLDQARRKAIELDAGKAGIEVADVDGFDRVRVVDAVGDYLKEIEPPQRERRTYQAYKHCLELFAQTCRKTYLQDVQREDLLHFIRKLYEMKCGPHTAYNRAVIVSQLLKANGIKGLLHKRDWPKYVDPIRPVYEPEELKALLAACTEGERTLYLFYLLTGMRDKEVRYSTWRDVDFRTHVVRVTAKQQYGFTPKNKEEREIPVPEALIAELRAHKDRQNGKGNPNDLVFPTANGAPDKKHEWKLKRIAFKAGLNCGRCASRHGNKCADGEFCSSWFLHKFRHTFATRNLQEHVCDIRTLQLWLGHSDLASTMVYLKAVRNREVAARVNGSELAAFAAATASPLAHPIQ
jgi:integrase/recombinase XerD